MMNLSDNIIYSYIYSNNIEDNTKSVFLCFYHTVNNNHYTVKQILNGLINQHTDSKDYDLIQNKLFLNIETLSNKEYFILVNENSFGVNKDKIITIKDSDKLLSIDTYHSDETYTLIEQISILCRRQANMCIKGNIELCYKPQSNTITKGRDNIQWTSNNPYSHGYLSDYSTKLFINSNDQEQLIAANHPILFPLLSDSQFTLNNNLLSLINEYKELALQSTTKSLNNFNVIKDRSRGCIKCFNEDNLAYYPLEGELKVIASAEQQQREYEEELENARKIAETKAKQQGMTSIGFLSRKDRNDISRPNNEYSIHINLEPHCILPYQRERLNCLYFQWNQSHSDKGTKITPKQPLVLIQLFPMNSAQEKSLKKVSAAEDYYDPEGKLVFDDNYQRGWDNREYIINKITNNNNNNNNNNLGHNISFTPDYKYLEENHLVLFVRALNYLNFTELIPPKSYYLVKHELHIPPWIAPTFIHPQELLRNNQFIPFNKLNQQELVKLSNRELNEYFVIENKMLQRELYKERVETIDSFHYSGQASNQFYGEFKGEYYKKTSFQSLNLDIIKPLQSIVDEYLHDKENVLKYKLYCTTRPAETRGGISSNYRFFERYWPKSTNNDNNNSNNNNNNQDQEKVTEILFDNNDKENEEEKQELLIPTTLLDLAVVENSLVCYEPHTLFYSIPIHKETIKSLDNSVTIIKPEQYLLIIAKQYKTKDKWSFSHLEPQCDDKYKILKEKLKLIENYSEMKQQVNIKNIQFDNYPEIENCQYFLFISCVKPEEFHMNRLINTHYLICDRITELRKKFNLEAAQAEMRIHLNRSKLFMKTVKQIFLNQTQLFATLWTNNNNNNDKEDKKDELEDKEEQDESINEYLIVANPYWGIRDDSYRFPLAFIERGCQIGVFTAGMYVRADKVYKNKLNNIQKEQIQTLRTVIPEDIEKPWTNIAKNTDNDNNNNNPNTNNHNHSDWILCAVWIALTQQECNGFYNFSKEFSAKIYKDVNEFNGCVENGKNYKEFFEQQFGPRGKILQENRHYSNKLESRDFIGDTSFSSVRGDHQNYFYCPAIERFTDEEIKYLTKYNTFQERYEQMRSNYLQFAIENSEKIKQNWNNKQIKIINSKVSVQTDKGIQQFPFRIELDPYIINRKVNEFSADDVFSQYSPQILIENNGIGHVFGAVYAKNSMFNDADSENSIVNEIDKPTIVKTPSTTNFHRVNQIINSLYNQLNLIRPINNNNNNNNNDQDSFSLYGLWFWCSITSSCYFIYSPYVTCKSIESLAGKIVLEMLLSVYKEEECVILVNSINRKLMKQDYFYCPALETKFVSATDFNNTAQTINISEEEKETKKKFKPKAEFFF